MQAFADATEVSLVVPLVDADGNELSVSAISYRVANAAGDELVPLTALAGFEPQSPQAVITVPIIHNTLDAGVTNDLRLVELRCTIESNTVILTSSYLVEKTDVLAVGVNSFMSMTQAELIATAVPNLAGWDGATRRQRAAALIEARLNICRLNFQVLNTRNQDSLGFVPEGARPTNYVGGLTLGGDLAELPLEQYNRLPLDLRSALMRAQLVEANAILGGEPLEDRRKAGLMLDTIGESKQMFRNEKPLDLPVCRRALGYLSKYVTFAKVVGR